jgi:hypothetical protein
MMNPQSVELPKLFLNLPRRQTTEIGIKNERNYFGIVPHLRKPFIYNKPIFARRAVEARYCSAQILSHASLLNRN